MTQILELTDEVLKMAHINIFKDTQEKKSILSKEMGNRSKEINQKYILEIESKLLKLQIFIWRPSQERRKEEWVNRIEETMAENSSNLVENISLLIKESTNSGQNKYILKITPRYIIVKRLTTKIE